MEPSVKVLSEQTGTTEILSWRPEVGTKMGSQGRLVTYFAEILTSAGLGPLSYKDFLDFWPRFLPLRPVGVGFNTVIT